MKILQKLGKTVGKGNSHPDLIYRKDFYPFDNGCIPRCTVRLKKFMEID